MHSCRRLDQSMLTELQVDQLVLIGTGLGPHVQLSAFAGKCKSRLDFVHHIVSKCTPNGSNRLKAVKPDMSNLDETSLLYGWTHASVVPELEGKPSYWIERSTTGNFLLCGKLTGLQLHVAHSLDPPPQLIYNSGGFHELCQFGLRVRCDHIISDHAQYLCDIKRAKLTAGTDDIFEVHS